MSFLSIAGSGAAKTMIAVTVSLHPGAAHHGSHHVTVRSGDTLSSISQREFGSAASWPALWWANRHSVHNPSMIQVGERLQVPNSHKVKPWLTRAALAAIPAPAPVAVPVAAPAAPSGTGTSAAPVQATASYAGAPGSFQSCVIQRESGGNASAVNASSGAGGLYGFLPSTWQSLGFSGLPENASVSEQNAAFAKEYAQSGGAAWSAYDGC
ncbi:MAG TPA: transglycosylase family protein [Streptosporangiaceae bacterium]